MAEFLEVREVGLRDGIQSIKTVVPTDLKLAWIKAEVAAGVRDIEVCSFVPPKLLPQFADAEEVTKAALQIPGLTVAALMPNLKGAERGAALGVHRLDYVVSVSESHNLNNVRRSTADSLADLQRIADFLKTIPSRASGRSCSAASRPRSAARSKATCRTTASCSSPRRSRRSASTRWRSPTRSASAIRTRSARCSRASCKAIGPNMPLARALPRHARAWHRQRLGRDRRRRAALRCLALRARRLPVGAGRDRQHRHRGRRVPRRVARLRHRHRPRQAHHGARDRAAGAAGRERSTARWQRPACRRASPTPRGARPHEHRSARQGRHTRFVRARRGLSRAARGGAADLREVSGRILARARGQIRVSDGVRERPDRPAVISPR